MPLLVALDEYDSAIQSIAIHARLGLESPAHQESVLRLILATCEKVDAVVEDALRHIVTEEPNLEF